MKITNLKLDAFRSFVGVELPTNAPRVYIAGLNGVGKSSIREAIRYALTGRCVVTDERGSGADSLTPIGKTSALVTLTLDDLNVTRGLLGGLKVEGWSGAASTQQTALYAHLGVPMSILDACLDSEVFVRLHHANAKALVLGLLDVRVKLGDAADAPVFTLEQLDTAYTRAFDDRKAAKLALKNFRMPMAPSTEAQPDLEAVKAHLGTLRAELDSVNRQIGTVAGERHRLNLELEAALPLSTSIPGLPPEESIQKELDVLQARLTEAERTYTVEVTTDGGATIETREMLSRRIDQIKAHHPSNGCVLDGSIPCQTAKLRFTRRIKELQPVYQALPVVDVPTTDIPTLRRQLAALVVHKEHYAKRHAQNQERADRRQATESALASLPDTNTAELNLATLRDRIAKGEGIQRAVEQHLRDTKAFTEAQAARQHYEAEVARLEDLCEQLGPNGIRVQALGDAIGRFEAAINPYLTPFGWEVYFSVDPWGVVVNGRPLESFSRSEQYRVGIAIQLAIAAASGLQFAIVDELDMLDVANRNLMTQLLLQSPVAQVIVLSTREATQPLPAMPGVLAYRLAKDGDRSVIQERSAA